LYSTAEAAALLSCARETIYRLMREGRLASVRLNSRRFIVGEELHRFVDQLIEASADQARSGPPQGHRRVDKSLEVDDVAVAAARRSRRPA
jgi:excisionase family DNA binding protein